jgi:hypothetical protein
MSNIRNQGLKYLCDKLGYKPKEKVAVSKLYKPEESWTQNYTWWFDLPFDKIKKSQDEDYYLVCEKDENLFIVLKIPNRFFIDNHDELETRYDEKIRLHLAAYKENWLVDERGKGKVDFSRFEVK